MYPLGTRNRAMNAKTEASPGPGLCSSELACHNVWFCFVFKLKLETIRLNQTLSFSFLSLCSMVFSLTLPPTEVVEAS